MNKLLFPFILNLRLLTSAITFLATNRKYARSDKGDSDAGNLPISNDLFKEI